jgi:tetratricopeptide (TPR) repeat protein
MAVAKGRMADMVGVNRRIELGHEIEGYVARALELMPEHAPSWHLYGVWQSEVANVSRAERIAARFLSGGLPDGSDEKAEEYLEKAMELDPESIIIRLDLARHYIRSGQDEKAIAALEELLALDLQPQVRDDPDHLKDARLLLEDLR